MIVLTITVSKDRHELPRGVQMLHRYQQHEMSHVHIHGDFFDENILVIEQQRNVDQQENHGGVRLFVIDHRRLQIHVVEGVSL